MSLGAGPASPSGLANRYGVVLFRFPAAVEITSLGAVSDALVCRLPWDSPRVERDRDILLGADRAAAQLYVQEWRTRAIATAQETMQLVRLKEMAAFGQKSYFFHWDRLRLYGIAMPEISDDEGDDDGNDEGVEERAEESDPGIDFAEHGED